jgi:hypothetical protein
MRRITLQTLAVRLGAFLAFASSWLCCAVDNPQATLQSAYGPKQLCTPKKNSFCRCNTSEGQRYTSAFIVRTCDETGTRWVNDCDEEGTNCPAVAQDSSGSTTSTTTGSGNSSKPSVTPPDPSVTVGCPNKCTASNQAVPESCQEPCIRKIIKQEEKCATAWSDSCVAYVYSVCAQIACETVACSHAICTEGTALEPNCDVVPPLVSCVSQICDDAKTSSCCTTGWDSSCVDAVATVCGQSCG